MIKNILDKLFPKRNNLNTSLLRMYKSHEVRINSRGNGGVYNKDKKIVINIEDYYKFPKGSIRLVYRPFSGGLSYSHYFDEESDFKKWIFYRLYVDKYLKDTWGQKAFPHEGVKGLEGKVHLNYHMSKYLNRELIRGTKDLINL